MQYARRLTIAAGILLSLAGGGACSAESRVPVVTACRSAITAAATASRLPSGLLLAVGLVETGRMDTGTGRVEPWPWSVNAAGTGYMPATKDEALRLVMTLQAQGLQSIDVGCMQVNLQQHPSAFLSLDEAFDPESNARYAAGFLGRLYRQTGTWLDAAAAYHSQTPGHSDAYLGRVIAAWPEAAQRESAEPARTRPRYGDNELPALRARRAEQVSDHARLARNGMLSGSPPPERRFGGIGPKRAGTRWSGLPSKSRNSTKST